MSHRKYDFCYPIAGIRGRVLAGWLYLIGSFSLHLTSHFLTTRNNPILPFTSLRFHLLYSTALSSEERNTVLDSLHLKVSAIDQLAFSSAILHRFKGPIATQLLTTHHRHLYNRAVLSPLHNFKMATQYPEARVLVIMTGGTICMRSSPDGLVPARGFLREGMAPRPSFNDGSMPGMC